MRRGETPVQPARDALGWAAVKPVNRMARRLFLVCCGATAAMRRGAFPRDEPADDRYDARAATLADRLPRVEQVLAGPALRAHRTAQAFAPSVTTEPALADQDFGKWAGRGLAAVKMLAPHAFDAWLSGPEAAPPGGESFVSVCRRTEDFMAGQLGRDGTTIAVTHPAPIRAAILAVLGAPPACFARIDVEPLSVTEFRGDGRRWMLRAMLPSV
jgi:broad specificity phosphatase PhoE